MGHSGYIDWHGVSRKKPGAHTSAGQSYVYAFWLVDYGRATADHGVTLLKREDRHPDWFLHAENADGVLVAHARPDTLLDTAGWDKVFGAPTSRPLLASVLLGTANRVHHEDATAGYWQCAEEDLTSRGKRLIKDLTLLYLRAPVLVTFLDPAADEDDGPEVNAGSATVGEGLGVNTPR